MNALEFLWYLNVDDKTKYMLIMIFVAIVCIFCLAHCKKKVRIKAIEDREHYLKDPHYLDYKKRTNKTECHQDYIKCIETNATTNIYDYFCFPCKENGEYPDQVFNPMIGKWIKVNN